MNDIIASIKAYVLLINSSIVNNSLLDFMVADVVDRALVYMNRDVLVKRYEENLLVYPDLTDDFWINYEFPIHPRLERTLANAVIDAITTYNAKISTDLRVGSISEEGMSKSYSDSLKGYFLSKSDSDVLGSCTAMLNKYRLASVTGTGNITNGQYR